MAAMTAVMTTITTKFAVPDAVTAGSGSRDRKLGNERKVLRVFGGECACKWAVTKD